MYKFISNKHIKIHPINTSNISKYYLEEKYVEKLELFLSKCNYTGVCNINFVFYNEEIKVLEINPRLGGSLIRFNKDYLVEILIELINIR
jgi:biotin carboxylase